jgi:hypothetical protein
MLDAVAGVVHERQGAAHTKREGHQNDHQWRFRSARRISFGFSLRPLGHFPGSFEFSPYSAVLAVVALALKNFAAFSSPFSLLTIIMNLVGTGCEGHEAAPRPRGCPASSARPERSWGCGKSFHTCERSGAYSPGSMRRVWRECTFHRTFTSSLGRFGNPHFRMPGVQTSNAAHHDRIGASQGTLAPDLPRVNRGECLSLAVHWFTRVRSI